MKIVNIVTLWDYGKPIEITSTMKDFNASVVKEGKPTLLTFASGKIVATGCVTLKQARELVRRHFSTAKFLRIVNMTSTAFLRYKPKIEKLPGVTYNPEIFPAYLWKKDNSKVVVIYYTTGKLIVTGAKSNKQLREAYNEFRKLTCINTETNVNKQ